MLKRGPKKKWVRGVDMKEFSGKSWRELEDIWPAHVRIASDAWRIMSVFPAALEANRRFQKELFGVRLQIEEICQLAWIQRCEEARSNVATETYPVGQGLEQSHRLIATKKARITSLGLIESIPNKSVRLYRVTEMGKIVLKNLVENMEKAHQNVKIWIETQPERGKERVNKFLSKYCFEWETLNLEREETKNTENP